MKIKQRMTDNIINHIKPSTLRVLPYLLMATTFLSIGCFFVRPIRSLSYIIFDFSLFGWADVVTVHLAKRGTNVFLSILVATLGVFGLGIVVTFILFLLVGD